MNLLNKRIFKITLLFLIFAELLSIFAWGLPLFNTICFFVILIITLISSIKKLKIGILILLTELFIGSHGYLFSLNIGATWLSIRIGLFMVIMLAWLVHVFRQGGIKQYYQRIKQFIFFKWYVALTVIIIWGLIWALIRGNNFGFIFLDFNNWLYFLILLPIFDIACPKKKPKKEPDLKATFANVAFKSGSFLESSLMHQIFQILTASITWLTIKTLAILYIFSHNFIYIMPDVYRWIRDTRVGEITLMFDNFYRTFFQSHIYSLLFFFIILIILTRKQENKKTRKQNQINTNNETMSQSHNASLISIYPKTITLYFLLTICLTTTIISFSRSFWAGLIVGFIILLFYYFIILKKWKIGLKIILSTALAGIMSLMIIFIVIKLPPYVKSDHITSLVEKRITQVGAAGSSRINMLKPLGQAILKNPILGSGFGTAITYTSVDPRVLQSTAGASGEYTTYAFEWAYLDTLLKFGLIGLIVYLGLILKTTYQLYKQSTNQHRAIEQSSNRAISLGFLFALFSLLAVNIFTPYLNHPLGIGFIVLSSIIADNKLTLSSRT